jgi:hypothetical protein
MRLNPDCIRDILLTVEENTGFTKFMNFNSNSEYEKLSTYAKEEVLYHIRQCEESSLLTGAQWYLGGDCMISDLSPYGHQFLADIRSETNWNKTKEISKNIGSFSLDSLKQIASTVISELIKSQLKL